MARCAALLFLAFLVLGSATPPSALAQATWMGSRTCFPFARLFAGCDVTYASKYVWRGITRRNASVLQPDAFVSWRWSSGFLSAGGWANIELERADPNDPTAVGLGQRVGEGNGWVQLDLFTRLFAFKLGYVRYEFNVAAAAPFNVNVFDTGEFFTDLRLDLPWPPQSVSGPGFATAVEVAAWYDREDVDGLYLEPSVELQLPFFPLLSIWFPSLLPALQLRAAAGVSVGQKITDPMNPDGYFASDGLTHWDFSATTSIVAARSFNLAVSYHLQVNKDENTRGRLENGMPDFDDDVKHWVRLSMSIIPKL